MKFNFKLLLFTIFVGCKSFSSSVKISQGNDSSTVQNTSLIILGTIQDGGSPHIGCKKNCCKELFIHPDQTRKVVSLGIIDPENKKKYIFEATPDLPYQMKKLVENSPFETKELPDGIFLTHAHIGHYTGLMYLGKEALNSDKVEVFAMPRMKKFIEYNGPWNQLVKNNNITLMPLKNYEKVELTSNISIQPLTVPHRDEYSETVGYIIEGPTKKVLFIPDIDRWEKWDTSIVSVLSRVDYAFIDGTFYDGEEINSRNISEIPHPFIVESMTLFKQLPASEKKKVYFIHFNHTNPVLNLKSKQYKNVIENGFNIASIGQTIKL